METIATDLNFLRDRRFAPLVGAFLATENSGTESRKAATESRKAAFDSLDEAIHSAFGPESEEVLSWDATVCEGRAGNYRDFIGVLRTSLG